MLIEKIAISAVAGAVMLSTAVGVFADGSWTNNWANVSSTTYTAANTGNNSVHGGVHAGSVENGSTQTVYGNGVTTGNARANTYNINVVNTNLGHTREGGVNNQATVYSYSSTNANTGYNTVSGGTHTSGEVENGSRSSVYGNSLQTGNAQSGAWNVNVVNTNVNHF